MTKRGGGGRKAKQTLCNQKHYPIKFYASKQLLHFTSFEQEEDSIRFYIKGFPWNRAVR